MKRFVATITAAAFVAMLVISVTASAGEKEKKNEKRAKKPKPTASPTVTPTTDPTEPPPPAPPPPCADMRVATPNYAFNAETGTGLLTLDVEVAEPSCSAVDYRLVVLDGVEEGAATLTETSVAGNGVTRAGLSGDPGNQGFVSYVVPVTDDDPEICIYSESISSDGMLLDRAPDEACLYIGPGPGNGGRPYN